MALFERYGWLSIDMYHQMLKDGMDFWYKEDGLLMIYTLEKSFEKKLKTCDNSGAYKILSAKETKEYMPVVNDNICGSVLLTENAYVDPGEVMHSLQEYLQNVGVEFLYNEEVIDFEFKNNLIEGVITHKEKIQAETIILATGANPTLIKKTKNDFFNDGG